MTTPATSSAARPPESGSAYTARADGVLCSHELTRGPWDPDHQHAGPPSATIARAVEAAAAPHGLTHLARLTVNLLRPVPIAELVVTVHGDYVGRSAGHFSGELVAGGRACVRFTALVLREVDVPVPGGTAEQRLPGSPRPAEQCPLSPMVVFPDRLSYNDLMEIRCVSGKIFDGPCCAWFRMRYPLVTGEVPSPAQRVAVAADSGNGISAAVDFRRYLFVNSDLTINLLRRPRGEWICLDAQSFFGDDGAGMAESVLYDEHGLIGRATQSLLLRPRPGAS